MRAIALLLVLTSQAASASDPEAVAFARQHALSVRSQALAAKSTAEESQDIAQIWGAGATDPWLTMGNGLYVEGVGLKGEAADSYDFGIEDFNAAVSAANTGNYVGAVSLYNDAAAFFGQAQQKWSAAELKFWEATSLYQQGG